ncbi:hypothetical protein J8J14_16520 [Roseomonas sp. SSH11]|uniref:DUF4433 domain-containing protein n=1 Tax=Pararoseomonas baculiformis TaxID=2820812 RepID=A0ABS4AIN1_9PROT|nr:hypothetical protein [Pararoseomonas baculiformis]MBP0446380.1 hypothetical protein [Pararoseomonas baculiformis]
MTEFAHRIPQLFHVTQRSALESIRAQGLRPAAELAAHHPEAITENRRAWTPIPRPGAPTAWLRWQNMPDGPIATRLAPGITPAQWRRFINSFVFFFPTEADARRLQASPKDKGQNQAILRFETAALLQAGVTLLTCRWNNGYLDRDPPERRRLRGFADYRPAHLWRRGENLGEITAQGGTPPGLPFAIID